MRLLGIDFETTGLDPEKDKIIEVGAILYDWETKQPVKIMSEFISCENNNLPTKITKLTGINPFIWDNYGIKKEKAFFELSLLVSKADYIIAHNASFDKSFFDKEITSEKQWICSRMDIDYPLEITTRKLTYLAAEHNIINPFRHRAVFDVLTMMEIVKQYDIKKIIERSKSPTITIQALVSYEEREKAKDAGFHWEAKSKTWQMLIKECDLQNKNFDFKIKKGGVI